MKKYAAFISYSRKDEIEAKKLHRKIESFRIPDDVILNSEVLSAGKKIRPVFRDKDELAASHDLSKKLLEALDASEHLIVICSPNSAKSKWVDAEIKHFLEKHGREKIIFLVIGGTPMVSVTDPTSIDEAFTPSTLLTIEKFGEPLWANLDAKADGRDLAWAKVISGLIGSSADVVLQRQKQAQKRVFGMVAVAASITVAVVSYFYIQAQTEHKRAAVNEKLAAYEKSLAFARKATSTETFKDGISYRKSLAWSWLALSVFNNELKGETPPSEVVRTYKKFYAQQFIRTLLSENNDERPLSLLEDNAVLTFPGRYSQRQKQLKKLNLSTFQSKKIEISGVSRPQIVSANKLGTKFFFETDLGKPNLIWDGEKLIEISKQFLVNAYFSKNDKYLITQPDTTTSYEKIEVWHVKTGRLKFSAPGITSRISNDLKYFALVKNDGTLELYSEDFELLRTKSYQLEINGAFHTPSLYFFGDENLLIISLGDKTEFLQPQDLSTVKMYETRERYSESIFDIPKSESVITYNGGYDMLLRKKTDWSIISSISIYSKNGTFPKAFLATSTDGKQLYWGDSGGGIKVIDIHGIIKHDEASLNKKLALTLAFLKKNKPLTTQECDELNVALREICQ